MKKKMFIENVRMETETEFFENGDINVHPCVFEMGRTTLTHESKVSYRGRITVMENGTTNVKAYHMGTQSPMYTKLYETEHCDVLRTRSGKIIERWRFSPKVPIHRIWEIRKQETPQVDAFFLTLK